jgi:hypothetical protein
VQVSRCGSDVSRFLRLLAVLAVIVIVLPVTAQDVSLEYRVKATYLFNFVKYVEWPAAARGSGPLTLCVAGRNPFGSALEDTIRHEVVDGRPLVVRVILEPEAGCHVLFVPEGAAVNAYLRAARGRPTLTIGESSDFLTRGGIINFVSDGRHVRFAISTAAADLAQLHISSRLLQLAVNTRGTR